ncbi:hypothetical protein P280DRAFT_198997 [Massarina eburnea CBS 473.64]|uniref:Uncharacterized protein n=1 Tax=Massarina eburnea CBS 473.64 TaxID=1395130 RepID=A0A6A6RIH7_9PLEO|nr:hypothetical protein P280DRAFT_198997 [Massarina eburnea CBS 473.64]
MPDSESNTNTAFLVLFGILSLLFAIAGLHYKDSLCCLLCRSLLQSWSHTQVTAQDELDVEVGIGDGAPEQGLKGAHELQPRLLLPWYLGGSSEELTPH